MNWALDGDFALVFMIFWDNKTVRKFSPRILYDFEILLLFNEKLRVAIFKLALKFSLVEHSYIADWPAERSQLKFKSHFFGI